MYAQSDLINQSAIEAPSPGKLTSTVRAIGRFFGQPAIMGVVVRWTECAVLVGLGASIAYGYVPELDVSDHSKYLLAPLAAAIIATSLFSGFGLYTVNAFNNPLRNAGRLVFGWFVAVGSLIAGIFFLKSGQDFSRLWLAAWFVAGLGGIALTRAGALSAIKAARRAGLLSRNAVIYGCGGSGAALVSALQSDPCSDVRIVGVFDDRGDDRATTIDDRLPLMGGLASLVTFARSGNVDMVVMALPLAAETRVSTLLQRLAELPVDVRLAASSSTLRLRPQAYSYIGSVPVIDLSDRPISGWNAVAKAVFDRVVALLAIVALAPVMALVAAAVKLDSRGPVLFRQKRYGFNNELIEVYKFRSMHVASADAVAAKLVTRNDPRVTRVGRIIRKSSLDELPQLFNVLFGSLSLVGPRPHAVQAKAADRLYPDVVDGYFARHKVKPGITGWAQINGWRGETDTSEKIRKRVEFDLAYIDNWSIWLDICILAKTPVALLSTESAY